MIDEDSDRYMEPMRMWREWYQKSEQQWSESLTDMLADEKMGQTWGRVFQEWLHGQHMVSELIGQQLAALNMPSRADILGIRDRVGEVEDAVSQLSAEIVQLRRQIEKGAATEPAPAKTAVKRTRKPATKKTAVESVAAVSKASDDGKSTDG